MDKNNINTWGKQYFSISYEKKSESCSHTKQSTVRGAPNIKNQVREDDLNDKVRFLPKMPYAEMMQYTMNGDLGLAIDHTDVLNHKLALPNKFFDYIQAEIPILATDITEVRAIIEKYDIGFVLEKLSY
jgi:glycosyltransferase involved in cell wall biosynthesis